MKKAVVLPVFFACFSFTALAQTPCIQPVITEVRGGGTYCTGELVTLRVMGSLNSGVEWAWYTGKCGGTKVGSGSSIVIEVKETTTYYVRGMGFCYPIPSTCASVDVILEDSAPVVISSPSDIVVASSGSQCGATVDFALPEGQDDCSAVDVKLVTGLTPGSFFPVGTTQEQYELSDAAGNKITVSFNVTVQENELPTITCPQDIVVTTEPGKCEAVVNYSTPQGSDNCSGVTSTLSTGLGSGATFPAGVTTETYTVTDASGNISTCSFKVIVQSNVPAAITCPDDIVVNNDTGKCGAIVNYTVPHGSDNCAGATAILTAGLGSGSFFPSGTTTETYTMSDGSGNSVSCSFKVTVLDKQPPVIMCPTDITVKNDPGKCGAVVTFQEPVGFDNCTGATTKLSAGLKSGAFFPLGLTTQIYAVTDSQGNTTTCSFTVNVLDKETPVITCPKDIVITNDPGKCGAIVSYEIPQVSDNCKDVTAKLSTGLGSKAFFPIGVTTETYTVTDAGGNTATCSFKVTVQDNELPKINCPKDIVVRNDVGKCGAVVKYQLPKGSDNCPDPTIQFSAGLGSGAFFPIGVTTESYTITDAAGNTTTCSFTVTVQDKELPVIVCQSDVTVHNEPGKCGAVVKYEIPKGTDNCPDATTKLSAGLGSGAFFPVGVTTEKYTVKDAAGNTATCSIRIIVEDKELPMIDCPADITVNNEPGKCSAIVNYQVPTGSDNCPDAKTKLTTGLRSGAIFPVGTTTQTYTVTDDAGNTASCSFTITVKDMEPPKITLSKEVYSLWPPSHKHHAFQVEDLIGSANDNCGDVSTHDVVIAKVESDEPNNGKADGNTDDDIQISADCRTVILLSERAGNQNGRVYVITLLLMDQHDNTTTTKVRVEVPHHQGQSVLDGIVYTVAGCDPSSGEDLRARNFNAKIPQYDNAVGRNGDMQPSVYPNPFKDAFTLTFTAPANDHVKVELYNLLGMQLAQVHEQDVEADRSYSWQIEHGAPNSNEYVLIIKGSVTRQMVRVIRRE